LMKIKCLVDVHKGISLKKEKIYEATQGQKGWFALIDETGEEYAYPPHIFEVVKDDKNGGLSKTIQKSKTKNKVQTDFPNIAVARK